MFTNVILFWRPALNILGKEVIQMKLERVLKVLYVLAAIASILAAIFSFFTKENIIFVVIITWTTIVLQTIRRSISGTSYREQFRILTKPVIILIGYLIMVGITYIILTQ